MVGHPTEADRLNPDSNARIAVVMTTHDRRDGVLETLPRLLALPEGPHVIVVDDHSPDDTSNAVTRAFPEVEVIRAPRNLGAAARTLGVEAAPTPYVAFADDDSWWEPGSLDLAADLLDDHPDVALLAAAIEVGPDRRPDPTNRLMADSPLARDGLPGPEILGFVACGAVVRRDAYLAVGGFHPALHIGGEEALLAMDLRTAGWRCVFVEALRARHEPDVTGERPGRRRRIVRNQIWTALLRRRPGGLARILATTVLAAPHDRAVRGGLRDALAGARRLVRQRRPVPPDVERDLRRLDHA